MMVCSKAMINVARKMEERYGIPYFEGSFYGISDTIVISGFNGSSWTIFVQSPLGTRWSPRYCLSSWLCLLAYACCSST